MEAERVIAYIILLFALAGVLACFAIYRVVQAQASAAQDDEAVPPPPELPTPYPWELKWLTCLTAATASLLTIQVALGICIGSLLLLADSVHGASDCATYGLASFVEYMKYSFGRRAVSPEMSAGIDKASALFSVAVVSVTSAAVAVEAGIRYWRRTGKGESTALGNAMLVVTGLGVFMNLSLLLLHSKLRSSSVASGGSQSKRATHRAGSWHLSLHSALHPGCQGHCRSHDGGSNAEEAKNLNVYGVLLHVITDVVRTLLMLVVGMLVRFGVFADTARVDAICAVVICTCVSLGSAWLLGAAFCAPRPAGLSRGPSGLSHGSGDESPVASYGSTS